LYCASIYPEASAFSHSAGSDLWGYSEEARGKSGKLLVSFLSVYVSIDLFVPIRRSDLLLDREGFQLCQRSSQGDTDIPLRNKGRQEEELGRFIRVLFRVKQS